MKEEQMNILKSRKGFIAALDQSGGSSKKTLANYGVNSYETEEEMFEQIHKMRSRIIKSKVFNKDRILGVILFQNTVDRKIDDEFTADYLWNQKKILSFLKIDLGLEEEKDGVQLLKNIPNLEQILKNAQNKHIFGTKMRSVIKEVNEKSIEKLVEQQFYLAKKISSFGLIPIIEPEVDIYAIEKFGCEQILIKCIKKQLDNLDENIKVIFKFTLPEKENFYDELLNYPQVLKIVALSGGYSQQKANQLLKLNKNMIASFSRALLENLNVLLTEEEFDNILNQTIQNIYDASINK
ncbi:MAG: fructose bisphosphate aldolase [Firmicutes bacterium]|nr:fructose bisphosphate aldolase [Bacillota bacterium]